MTASYRLVYFDARGRAEPARMMFALKGQPFIDDRFKYEDWPKLKHDKTLFPCGKAPTLVINNDVMLTQSKAIWQYLAREFGFYGGSSLEAAKIDVVMETMSDIQEKMVPLFGPMEESKRGKLITTFVQSTSKPYFTYLEELIKGAGGKNFVGNQISIADLYIFSMLDLMTDSKYTLEGVLDPYPGLCGFVQYIRRESALKSYLESRPSTPA